jgi:uroporphyrinogen-III synthase
MRIAITRLKDKAARDPELCRTFGHECYPVSPLRSAIYQENIDAFLIQANAGAFDCIFFTSALPAKLIGPHLTSPPRVVSIGPQTTKTLQEFGIQSETLPAFYSRDFAPYLGDWLKGKTVGIPRADVPNPDLIRAIEEHGGKPAEHFVYALEPTGEQLDLANAEAVIFTSANSFSFALWEDRSNLLKGAIGDITAERMEKKGVIPDFIGDGSLSGTLSALNIFLATRTSDTL